MGLFSFAMKEKAAKWRRPEGLGVKREDDTHRSGDG
jgi:hypothetical protein